MEMRGGEHKHSRQDQSFPLLKHSSASPPCTGKMTTRTPNFLHHGITEVNLAWKIFKVSVTKHPPTH